jgi:hypothetical protein
MLVGLPRLRFQKREFGLGRILDVVVLAAYISLDYSLHRRRG